MRFLSSALIFASAAASFFCCFASVPFVCCTATARYVSVGFVVLRSVFSDPSGSVAFVNDAPCDYAFYMTTVQNGLYSIHAEAVAGDTVVAISPESPPYSFRKGSIIDVLLALTPCGASCP